MAHQFDDFRGRLVPLSQVTEPSHGRFSSFHPGVMLLPPEYRALGKTVTRQPQTANHERQRKPLHSEGHEDDKESQKDDEIAVWKWCIVRQGQWNAESGRKRDAPTHPGPSDKKGILPRRRRIAFAQ